MHDKLYCVSYKSYFWYQLQFIDSSKDSAGALRVHVLGFETFSVVTLPANVGASEAVRIEIPRTPLKQEYHEELPKFL
eukprot:2152685-Amphidinium_carterae.1